ncbi:DHA2 family multidrug resistance protein-like MFS transporter [Arthrobacter sp. B3I9]|uniref:MFS transporter n=1 Tax=Arthrobacter sp. B3I9 TaxID=3042270 RepID=UPI002790B887|nr:MFS transporter [Arthrobacter sp. B3I9]MDQ0851542.1 DHA2 family multidrug resistance protein-like MFS transporter [Arthrobacter sp. B3I9]
MSNTFLTAGSPTSAALRPRAPWRDWLALSLLMFPVLLVAVDNTALTFALPAIARSLDASGVQLLWIVDAYPMVLAGLLVAMGSLGDRIGRRRLLFIGGTGFAAVSAATAFAPSAEALIAGRAALGFFGAMLMPSTLSLIRNIFPEPNRRRLAVAIWAAGFSGGAALGPIFGGWLVEHFWWGAVLLVAVPIILPLLALGPFLVPEFRDPNPGRVDVPSIILSLTVMVPVVFGIKELATHGTSPVPLAAIGVGLLMGYVFVRRQRALLRDGRKPRPGGTPSGTAAPLLDVSLFGNRVFSTAITANVLALFSFNGFILFLAQHLQLLEGQSPSESGAAMVPALIATVAAGLLVVPLVRKVRPGFVVAGGLLLSGTGYSIVAFGDHGHGPALLLAALLILCLGVGAAETISNDLILGAAPAEKSGAAAAVSETGYEIGSLLGTAILGSILTASYQGNLRLPDGVGEAAPAEAVAQAKETLAGAVDLAQTLPGPLAEAVTAAAGAAFDSGVHITAAIALVLMAGASVLAAVVLRKVPTAG